VLGGVLVVLIVTWLCLPRGSDSTENPKTHGPRAAAVFEVTRSAGQPGSFKTVREALGHARPGDRIVVLDETLEETLVLQEGNRAVTIEAGRPNHGVRWICPPVKDEMFIGLTGVEGLHLKGFTFDGLNRVKDLVKISGHCPGLVLEDVQLEGFTRLGVALWNCTGNANKEITIKDVRFITKVPVQAGLAFFAQASVIPPQNENIVVSDCRFEGPFASAVQFASAAVGVELHRNRFFGSADGLLYNKGSPRRYRLHVKLDSNTFYAIQKSGLHLQGVPLAGDKSLIELQNNLFGRTPALAQADELDEVEKAKQILSSRGNVRDPESKEGNLLLPAIIAKPFTLGTDPNADATFLRYPKTSELAQAGVEGQSVGVPPPE
jgi:hypothetical protein